MVDVFEALANGNANFQYAFHIYGYPYCLCSSQTLADDIAASTTLKTKIFGSGEDEASDKHYTYCKIVPGAINIPGPQAISIDETDPIPQGGDWSIEIYDRDYGLDWTASPYYFPSNLRGLIGLQSLAEINNPSITTVPVSSILRKSGTSFSIIDPTGAIDDIFTAHGHAYLWIGSECVYCTSIGAGTDPSEYTLYVSSAAYGRGVFRSQNQSHYGALSAVGLGTLASTVPLGSPAGLGCALWVAHYDSDGNREPTLYKWRHGRVKSRSTTKNGIITLSCANWFDWLKSSMPISRGDLQLAKYVFTRCDETSRMSDLAWQDSQSINLAPRPDQRIPHLGVMISGGGKPNDTDYYDVWLCANDSYRVFDTIDDVLAAVNEELSLCWDGDSGQYSGDGSTESPYHHWSNTISSNNVYSYLWRPVVANGRLDVVKQDATSYHRVRFYGIIPWLFGLGPIQTDSKDFFTYWCRHLGPNRNWTLDTSIGAVDRLHFVYPYSVYADGYSSYDTYDQDTQEGDLTLPDWSCMYYYDQSQLSDWRDQGDNAVDNLFSYWKPQPQYALTIPRQTISGNPRCRIYTQPDNDPRIFDDEEQILFDNAKRLDGEPGYAGLIGTVENNNDPSVGADGYGIIDLESHDWGTWVSGHQLDTTVPAIVVPMLGSDTSKWPFNQWSSIFYCPGSPQDSDEMYGGDPFIVRTKAGGWFERFSTPIKAMLGAYGAGTPVSSFSCVDFIPDIDGSSDHPSSIDWDSLDEVIEPIVTGHLYHLDASGSFDLSKILSNEMVLHGCSATWELDPAKDAYIMRFKPYSLVSGTASILSGSFIDTTNIRAGELPEITVNDVFRYNTLKINANKYLGKYLLPIYVENQTAKSRMGRTAQKELNCELSYFKTIQNASITNADFEVLNARLQDTFYHLSRDYPQIEISLTGKALASAHLGADMLLTDPRIRDPYSGAIGITRKGIRINSVRSRLDNYSLQISASIIGNPVYGWAPAAYSPTGESYFYDDSGTERLLFVVPVANKNWFTTDGSRQDLSYFVDMAYNKQTATYTTLSDTDFAVKLIKRWEPGQSVVGSGAAICDASTLDLTNVSVSNAATIVINGLDKADFSTTLSSGKYYVDHDLILIFDTIEECEDEQLIYATLAYDDGTIYLPNETYTTGTRWQ